MKNKQNTPKLQFTSFDGEWGVKLSNGYLLSDLSALQWGSLLRKTDRQIRSLGEIAYQRNTTSNRG
jgi:hypothetical protein